MQPKIELVDEKTDDRGYKTFAIWLHPGGDEKFLITVEVGATEHPNGNKYWHVTSSVRNVK
jgi:desulfoferrodoxin (superoxide reductase-like protein)